MLLSNKTLSIECYSETSINCVFMFYCYFVSIVYYSLDVFYIINFMFFLHFIPCCMYVCHMRIKVPTYLLGWLGSRVVSVLDSGAEGPRFKSQSRRCRVTVLGKLFIPIVPLFTKQQNW